MFDTLSISTREMLMVLRKPPAPPPPPKRRVWRISQAAPMGEYVDVDAAPPPRKPEDAADPAANGGWVLSSFDLLQGIDVSDGPETVPDDLFDELFPAPPETPPR